MEPSECLINCLKMSQFNQSSSNVKQEMEDFTDENKLEMSDVEEDTNQTLVFKLIESIKVKEEMDKALFELSKQRENLNEIAVYIYYSTGTMAIL